MKIELTDDGFEKIETKLREVEDLALAGMFQADNTPANFQRIVSETRNLRHILRENFVFVPGAPVSGGPPAA